MNGVVGHQTTLGAKVAPEVALAVDRAILAYPRLFADRSSFIRAAISRLLNELRFAEMPVNLQSPGGAVSKHTDCPRSVNRKGNASENGGE